MLALTKLARTLRLMLYRPPLRMYKSFVRRLHHNYLIVRPIGNPFHYQKCYLEINTASLLAPQLTDICKRHRLKRHSNELRYLVGNLRSRDMEHMWTICEKFPNLHAMFYVSYYILARHLYIVAFVNSSLDVASRHVLWVHVQSLRCLPASSRSMQAIPAFGRPYCKIVYVYFF